MLTSCALILLSGMMFGTLFKKMHLSAIIGMITAGGLAVVLVIGAMIFRMSGVATSLLKTSFNQKERLFCMLAYTPKATVQAAIGAIPLAMGFDCGELIMTVSAISILLTAPFGAICIDHFSDVLLGDGDRL